MMMLTMIATLTIHRTGSGHHTIPDTGLDIDQGTCPFTGPDIIQHKDRITDPAVIYRFLKPLSEYLEDGKWTHQKNKTVGTECNFR